MGSQLLRKIKTPDEGYQELCKRIIQSAKYDIKIKNRNYDDAVNFMNSDWGEVIDWYANIDLSKPTVYSTYELRNAIRNKIHGE